MEATRVHDALLRMEWLFHPDNPDRPGQLSNFWFGPKGLCIESYCYKVVGAKDLAIVREVVRRLSAEIKRIDRTYADLSPSRTIHRFNAVSTTSPTSVYCLVSTARSRLEEETWRKEMSTHISAFQ